MNELDLKENSNKTYAMFHKPRWYSTTESREITKTVPFVVVQSLSCDRLFVTPWTAAHQDPLSMCPPPVGLPYPGIEPTSLKSPALAGRFLTTSATWEAVRAQ